MSGEQVVIKFVVDPSAAEAGASRYVAAMRTSADASDKLLTQQEKIDRAMARQMSGFTGLSQAQERAARGYQRMADAIDPVVRAQLAMEKATQAAEAASRRGVGTNEDAARSIDLVRQKHEGLTSSLTAGNDNQAKSMGRVGEAFASAGEFALKHPILVAAGSVAAARALSGYAATAAVSLAGASAATARYASGASAMGGAVVTGATMAARGLGGLSTAAAATSGGLATYAAKVADMTTVTSLLSRGLGLLPGLLGPIGVAFLAFEAGSKAIEKASSDFDKLTALGERAQKLDLSAAFVKSFEDIAPKLHSTVEEIDASLKQAVDFVKDRLGQFNQLEGYLRDLQSKGYNSDGIESATRQVSAATTNDDRIRAAITAMKELEAAGYRVAELDLASKLFPAEIVDRLRTGELTAEQIGANLDQASRTQVVQDEQVARARALEQAIADTKQGISDAFGVSLDFSEITFRIKEAWLAVLQTIQSVVGAIGGAIEAAGRFATTIGSAVNGAIQSASGKLYDLLGKVGLTGMNGVEPVTPKIPVAPLATPKPIDNSGRSFPYNFGPTLAEYQKAQSGAAKAARDGAGAQRELSDAYDNAMQRSKDQVDELKLQATLADKNTEQVYRLTEANKLLRAAKSAGRADDDGVRDAIEKQSAAFAAQKIATEQVIEAHRRLVEGQREVASQFASFAETMLTGSGKISDALGSLGKSYTGNALKALISGEGPLAGALGTAPATKGGVGGIMAPDFFDRMTKAVSGGTMGGFMGLFGGSPVQGPTQSGATLDASKGVGIGQAGSALLGLAAAYGVGRSSGSTTQGALGGGLSGFAAGMSLSGGSPIGGAIGAAVGAAAGPIGRKQATRKEFRHECRERFREFDAGCADDGQHAL